MFVFGETIKVVFVLTTVFRIQIFRVRVSSYLLLFTHCFIFSFGSHSHQNDREQKGSSSDDSYERVAIPPDQYDMMLTDINEKGLKELGDQEGIVNLSPAEFPSVAFPVEGVIYGENDRLMVCLPCRRVKKSAATVNVWFLIDTGSYPSFLAKKTIEALIRDDDPVPDALRIAIQDPDSQIECHISPPAPKSHFENANVLGMKALRILELSIDVDWKHSVFKLIKK